MAYEEWSVYGASCPAGHTMGEGHDTHPECEWCGTAVYGICASVYVPEPAERRKRKSMVTK